MKTKVRCYVMCYSVLFTITVYIPILSHYHYVATKHRISLQIELLILTSCVFINSNKLEKLLYEMFQLVVVLFLISLTHAKIYDRCEFAKLLKNADITGDNLNKWVCIGQQAGFNTEKTNLNANGIGSYGVFQISDEYWCAKDKGSVKMCGISCSKLIDENISDDIACALTIYNEHKQRTGDGFSAWLPWIPDCKNTDTNYLHECHLGVSDILSIDVRFGEDDDGTTENNEIVSTNKIGAADNDEIVFKD